MGDAIDEIQSDTLRVLREHITEGTAALVDFPSHQNAGDSLIFAGEIAYMRRLGVNLSYICDIERFDSKILKKRAPTGPILLHGGGNFGDRWPRYQQFRERVIREFPDRKIILLPQSIEFRSNSALESAKQSFSGHGDLVLLMREERSFKEAGVHFGEHNRVEYCPDMAFGVGLQARSTSRREVDVVQLLRQDSERVDRGEFSIDYSTEEFDWGLSGLDAALWKMVRIPGRLSTLAPGISGQLYPLVHLSYLAQAKLNLHRASRTLQKGRVLLTDRLHAAVLGGLLGMNVVALDNSYGKISSVYADYLHKLQNVQFAGSKEVALDQVRNAMSVIVE